ncbi:hypothetical protein LRP30_02960 [Bradyrhizobium sp. C-145]|uniref:hypothetical protein n=1 Tax=Bradyrhizobium sp. C-145 TaxID=574727 RepID=UPI00201B7D89|nr:hypothetical protein [Bradyrhizobium sp. C-145]UQR64296.1 hypothetical protein LRP30_02960 [Bradyrhizobium sp. C-145]
MTDNLEDLILLEARRQGYQPNAAAMMRAAIDLAGSFMTTQNLISMPGKGSISPADFVRSLRAQMPDAFGNLVDTSLHTGMRPVEQTLTQSMREEIAAGRKQSLMPDDWRQVRAKYASGTLTAKMMDERAAERRQGTQNQ